MERIRKTALILAIALGAAAPAAAQMYPGYWHEGWGWGHGIFGLLMMVVFWGGIILVIIFAVRWLGLGPHGRHLEHPGRNNALEILKERFARGEIDKEEFEERKRLLTD